MNKMIFKCNNAAASVVLLFSFYPSLFVLFDVFFSGLPSYNSEWGGQ